MSNVIAIAGDFEDAGQMIEAIKAFRERQAAELAAEEAAANEAIKTDPEVKKWVWAAALENASNN
jgi:roadblock/LC7 domain-containing protein